MPKKTRKPKTKCVTPYCRNDRANTRRVCAKCHMRKWRAKNPVRAAFCAVRDHAKERRIPFQLTFAEFELVIEGTGYIDQKGSRKTDLQIDRVDASKAYSFDNVRVVTCEENATKSNWERHLPAHVQDMLRRKREQELDDNEPF